ncbi:MAG: early E1A protein [Eubacterium sp.]
MLSQGNGNAEVTSQNLIKIIRGEVPYDRIRGIDVSYIDRPVEIVKDDVENDVIETLEDYEPRVDVQDVNLEQTSDGSFKINLEVTKVEEQEAEDEFD